MLCGVVYTRVCPSRPRLRALPCRPRVSLLAPPQADRGASLLLAACPTTDRYRTAPHRLQLPPASPRKARLRLFTPPRRQTYHAIPYHALPYHTVPLTDVQARKPAISECRLLARHHVLRSRRHWISRVDLNKPRLGHGQPRPIESSPVSSSADIYTTLRYFCTMNSF